MILKAKSFDDGKYAGLIGCDPSNIKHIEFLQDDLKEVDFKDFIKELKKKDKNFKFPPKEDINGRYHFYKEYLDEHGFIIDESDKFIIKNKNTNDKYFSDYDLEGISKVDGSKLSKSKLKGYLETLNKELGQELDLIQHGPQDYLDFVEDMNKAKGPVGPQYKTIIDKGEEKIKKSFTVVFPDGEKILVKDNTTFLQVYAGKLGKDALKNYYPMLYKYYKANNNTLPKDLHEFY